MRIPLSAPDVTETEIEAVLAVLRTPTLSIGPRVAEFEAAFADRIGVAHAVALSSGTAGLHLAVRSSGIGPGDEVITSPFSFVASANAILYEGAVPVFVDVDPATLNMDPSRVEAAITPRTRALLVVHVFGRPAPMRELLEVARRHGLKLIEDACEALGAETLGRSVGSLGDCGVFAFYPNKQITTGEGGMLVTQDAERAALARSLRNHGRDAAGGGEHARLGYNYRLSELASALGTAQLGRLTSILALREEVARGYAARLSGQPDLVLPPLTLPEGRVSWFVYVVRLAAHWARADRDRILAALQAHGIGCQRYFAPLHLQPHLRAASGAEPGDFPHTEAASDRTLALPFFNRLRAEEIQEVADRLLELLQHGPSPH
jgi:perosamine synthetase